MLPSLRIQEIQKEKYIKSDSGKIQAIIDYIDEQYEQSKPCDHEDGMYKYFINGVPYCKNCNLRLD